MNEKGQSGGDGFHEWLDEAMEDHVFASHYTTATSVPDPFSAMGRAMETIGTFMIRAGFGAGIRLGRVARWLRNILPRDEHGGVRLGVQLAVIVAVSVTVPALMLGTGGFFQV